MGLLGPPSNCQAMSLTEILKLFDFPDALIPGQTLPDLYRLSDALPPVPLAGFESTLHGAPCLDFQQGFRAIPWDRQLLGSLEPCCQLAQAWSAPAARAVDEIWLEFDDLSFSKMGVFLGLDIDREGLEAQREAIRIVLSALGAEGWHTLERYQQLCQDDQRISHFGLMPHRGSAVRLNVKRVQPERVRGFLQRAQWPGPPEVVTEFEKLAGLVDHFALCLDVDARGGLLDTLAIECFLRQQPPLEGGWARLLSQLDGLCAIDPQRVAELLSWPAILTPVSGREWPSVLMQRSLLDAGPATLRLQLSHVKVQWRAGLFQAKAYFGFEYVS